MGRFTEAEMLRAMYASDASLDGQFFTCVRSTGIFCFPSCPARKPKAEHVFFVQTRSEAQRLGFRPCKRCCSDLDGGRLEYEQTLVANTITLIDQHLARLTLPWLAEQVGLSPSHLTRLVRRQTGTPFEQLVRRRRAERAAALLRETDDSILDIAATVGFESPSSLYAAFRQFYTVPPAAYRDQSKREEAYVRDC